MGIAVDVRGQQRRVLEDLASRSQAAAGSRGRPRHGVEPPVPARSAQESGAVATYGWNAG
jgi:hypothetical protein